VKAAELIQKEPFPELFTATLSDLLAARFGGEWKVTWREVNWRMREQPWLVNLHINAVFCQGVSKRALENVRREFATSVVWWKRPLQRLYFWLATSAIPRTGAQAILEIEPSIPNATECLIIPGTHKIRMLEAGAGISYCYLKRGSSLGHFQDEVKARTFAASKSVPVPRILQTLSESCIAEEMVVGTPLNRLTSNAEQTMGLRLALDALEPLYEGSAKKVNVKVYAAELVDQIDAIANVSKSICATGASDLARELCDRIIKINREIELVRCHGDFQAGNILYDCGRVWLIDWEYSCDRQRNYDLLTYHLRARFARGLEKRIAAYADASPGDIEQQELQLFLLEVILYECEAARIATSHYVPESLIAKLSEIGKAFTQTPMAGVA
jgi:aminoglycoside phosphotransferase